MESGVADFMCAPGLRYAASGLRLLRPQPHPQLCIYVIPCRHRQDGQRAFGVVDVVNQTELWGGNFYLVAVWKFAQRIFGYARVLEAFAGEFFLEAALDAAIQFRPFLFGVRVDGEFITHPA